MGEIYCHMTFEAVTAGACRLTYKVVSAGRAGRVDADVAAAGVYTGVRDYFSEYV